MIGGALRLLFFRCTFLALYLKSCCPEVRLRRMMPLNYASKVAVIVTVPGEIPYITPREFTVAILTSELSNTGFSAEVFGLIIVSSRILWERGTET